MCSCNRLVFRYHSLESKDLSMKKVILTITPNPALDLSGLVTKITPNEKTYVSSEQRAPGGNAINAARILHRLQVPVVASGFLGGGTGSELDSLLLQEGLQTHFVKIEGSTRVNITVSLQDDHQQTRFSFPGPQIKTKEKRQLFDFVKEQKSCSMFILGGSLPSGFSPQDILKLMRLSKKKNIECIVDFPGAILREVIPGRPLLIKPNLQEFQALTQTRVRTVKSVIKAAKKFLEQVPYICVSSVEGGALMITQEGAYFGKIPKIEIRSSVGAGDSMVGAMAAQIHAGKTCPELILRWGLASAAATLSQSGTTLGSSSQIRKFFKDVHVFKV